MRVARRPSFPLSARAGVAARGALLALAAAALPACATSRAVDGVDDRAGRLALAASAPGHVSTVGDVSTRFIQGTALSNDPMRPLADVIGSYWRITARRDPRAVRTVVGDQEVGVYAGMSYLGGWDYLRTVRSSEVARVQRLTTSEAYFQYGRQHANGAIVLTLQPAARR
jgi:hypothetical protein